MVRIELLASKNRGINLLHRSEKQSLIRFLGLYIFLVLILVVLLSVFYYKSQEELMFSNYRTIMSGYADQQIKKLKSLHHYFPKKREYPRSELFESAIYDIERQLIFTTLQNNQVNFDKEISRVGDKIHYVRYLDEYYLGAKYLFIEIDEDKTWFNEMLVQIVLLGSSTLFLLGVFGLFFVRLFLRPMRHSIELLDNFIKDTTHELNTPISAILANVEMMDQSIMAKKNIKKLSRINIAAKTVSHLYQDLTYLVLGHQSQSRDECIDLKKLIEARVEYFMILAQSKRITFELDLEEKRVFIDAVKIARVIDNLISNAIKYNKRSGKISILLRENYFSVSDTGIGIEEDKVAGMFDRYSRFNSTEGGFGIGLSIVKSIVDEYQYRIKVDSVLHQGTTISIYFNEGDQCD